MKIIIYAKGVKVSFGYDDPLHRQHQGQATLWMIDTVRYRESHLDFILKIMS